MVRGVKVRLQGMRSAARQVRNTRQASRPWLPRMTGLTKLHTRESPQNSAVETENYLRMMVNTELPAVTIPLTRPRCFLK